MDRRFAGSSASWLAVVFISATVGLCGCSLFRDVEQWKCDNWGMCHFGTRPSGAFPPVDVPTFEAPGMQVAPPACPQCTTPGY